jgi:hypothetical protein
MFKLDLSPTYSLPVTVQVRDASGEIKPETFRAEFLRMGPAEFNAFREDIAARQLDNIAISTHILKGWSELVDNNGAAVPFTDLTRDALLQNVTGAAEAVMHTWFESVMEDVRKNLLPPPATGPAATVAPRLIG